LAIADDFTVAVNGDIRHAANNNHYTVLELHRWLQDLADDDYVAVSGDYVDITSLTPSERSTDQIITLLNGYNIDDDASEYFYGGSITQGSGATEERYSGLQVLGAVNDSNTQLEVIQLDDYYDTASPFWGDQSGGGYNGDSVAGILMRVMIKTRIAGVDLDQGRVRVQARAWGDTYDFFTVTLGDGEAVAAISTTPDAQNDTAIGTVQGWTGGDIPTNTEGYQLIDLNNGNGDQPYYSQWTFNSNANGLKAIWEWIKEITGNDSPEAASPHGMNGELFLGITHEWDYDGSAGAYTEDEDVVWGTDVTYNTLAGGTFTVGYLLRFSGGAAGEILYDNGSTGCKIAITDTTDTIADLETITEYNPSTGAASGVTAAVNGAPTTEDKEGGRGQILATTGAATGTMWIQLLTGRAPVDGLEIRGITSTRTGAVNGAPTSRTVPKIFLGSYTGSLIGAFGIGVDPDDLTASDNLTDLLNVSQDPPNNVTWTLSGLVSGDRILVGNKDTGNDFEWDEMTIDTGGDLTGAAETIVDVGTGNVPPDAPSTGVLRITLDDGRIRRVPYLSHDGDDEFTIASTDFSGSNEAAAGNGVMLAFLDQAATGTSENFTIKYNADRTLWVRVREGTSATPIKTFEVASTLNNQGGSATALRIDDY
jgi:hypothetical protein